MSGEPADEELLSRFNRGDPASLGELARRYEQPLLGLASGLLGGRADLARDAVQDSWVRVIRYGKGFGGKSAFKTWVYRIVINRCRDLRGKEAPTGTANGVLARDADAPIETAERNTRLNAALEHVPPAARLVLLLCYHQGLTHTQAAEVLGIPPGTLKSRLNAALATLRTQLSADEDRP